MYASGEGHLLVIEELFKYKADPNIQNSKGQTALMYASQNNHLKVVKKLLANKRTKIDITDNQESTALTYASRHGNLDIVEELLENQANPNITTGSNCSLVAAVRNGHLKIVERLLDGGAYLDKEAIVYATIAERFDIIEILVNYGADINDALYISVQDKNVNCDFVEELLVKGVANPDHKGPNDVPAICFFVKYGRGDVVEIFLKNGANPNSYQDPRTPSETILVSAIRDRFYNIAEMLIEYGADDPKGRAYTYAISANYLGIVEKLLKKDIDISDAQNLLDVAQQKRKESDDKKCCGIVRALEGYIIDNASTNPTTAYGLNTLKWAVHRGYSRIVKELIKNNKVDFSDVPEAITIAIQGGRFDIAREFLKIKNVDSNIKAKWIEKALMRASERGYTDFVEELLEENNIDPESIKKALIIAKKTKHFDVVKVLQTRIASFDTYDICEIR